jgi:SAM-dependent methyltransferase
MSTPEASFWNNWNTAHRRPDEIVPDSLPMALGQAVVDAVSALPVERPRILELGCGTGWLANQLAAFGPYTGWDLSEEAIELARERFPLHRFEVADIHDVCGEDPFDVVVSVDAIAYFRDQGLAFRNVHDVLTPGGHFVVSTVNPFAYSRMSWIGPPGEGQVRKWLTRSSLHALLERTSFDVVSSRTILPAGDTGVLRWVNSRKVNAPFVRLLGASRVTRLKEASGLGQYRLVVARTRSRR